MNHHRALEVRTEENVPLCAANLKRFALAVLQLVLSQPPPRRRNQIARPAQAAGWPARAPGSVRAGQPAYSPTERGYTGQRLDLSTDLMYYEARYYDPLLARFVQADTIVPEAGSSQGLNRYSYSSNRPTTIFDPTGHCPQPAVEFTYVNVICLAGFIPTDTSTAIPYRVFFQGDSRDFSSKSEENESRFWVWIDADTGLLLRTFVHPTQQMSEPRGTPVGEPSPPRNDPFENKLLERLLGSNRISSSKADDGSITLTYHVVCSDSICNDSLAPDGVITFHPNDAGSYEATGEVNRFPNLEAYHWKNGALRSEFVFQIQNFSAKERSAGHAEWITSFGMAFYQQFDTRVTGGRISNRPHALDAWLDSNLHR
jgi:RHS repeat-associated protein